MLEKVILIILVVLIGYAFCIGCAVAILRNSKTWEAFTKAMGMEKRTYKRSELVGACIVFAPVFLVFFMLLSIGIIGYKITKRIVKKSE